MKDGTDDPEKANDGTELLLGIDLLERPVSPRCLSERVDIVFTSASRSGS